MRVRHATASAAAIATSLVLVSGCGASHPSATSASSSSSGSSSSSASASGSAAARPGHLDRSGVIRALTVGQTKGGTAHLVMRLAGAATLSAQGDVDYSGGTPQMRMTMAMPQLGAGTVEVRLVKGIIYLHLPKATPAGKFLRVDPSNAKDPMAGPFSSLGRQLDPLSSFRAMKGAVRSVRYVGRADVDGTATDHYVMTVDSAKLFASMKQPTAAKMPATLRYDLWFDGRDLLRRMRTQAAGERTEVTLSGWGRQVTVAAPPRSAIVSSPSTTG